MLQVKPRPVPGPAHPAPPWLLLVAVGILLWIKFGPRRSHQ
jgi:hypothetical protein